MFRRIKTIIKYSTISLCFLLFCSPIALAQDNLNFTPNISIPGSDFIMGVDKAVSTDTSTICQYLIAVYKYLIGSIGIFAAVALIIGGVIWITAAGSPARIGTAKSWIASSLIGLALALGAFLLLATINPELVICRHLKIDALKNIAVPDSPKINRPNDKACKWEAKQVNEVGKCGPGYTKEKNSYCVGQPLSNNPLGAIKTYPQVHTIAAICCCADNKALSQGDYCQQVGEGATCRLGDEWGYCEEVNDILVCRSCKKRLSEWVEEGKTPQDTADEADKISDVYKCYHNNNNFECPDKVGICGDLGNNEERDCNSNVVGLAAGASCWDINDWTNLALGTFFVQCRCK